MPTVHRQEGFRVIVNTDDHRPAHVHCVRGDAVVIVNLATERAAATLRESNKQAKHNDLADAVRIVNENDHKLWNAWRFYHGDD